MKDLWPATGLLVIGLREIAVQNEWSFLTSRSRNVSTFDGCEAGACCAIICELLTKSLVSDS